MLQRFCFAFFCLLQMHQVYNKMYLAKSKKQNLMVKTENKESLGAYGNDYQLQAPQEKKCQPQGQMKQMTVIGCGGRLELKCTNGCIQLHKVLYSCVERNDSNANQEDVANKKCKGNESCKLTANRNTFGSKECPDIHESEMSLWVSYTCDGSQVIDESRLSGRRRCPRNNRTNPTTTPRVTTTKGISTNKTTKKPKPKIKSEKTKSPSDKPKHTERQ